ncbi:NAD(P)H-dependent oxidoreductase [Kineobactrum salinum]|uniref:NAD(P)H-dependent oxidoreductase n=1 Tax=Kineobactrum salinum TaxID=2708301 RepID=A0A6C0U7R2_9GAMM|nr:NAD(P)H-dependent oxidoreductase [Kineobactrum salinum]QIB67027.1 NAD(P)H-dependent oxidoreductase [Kineobactrum salinum]
MEVLEALNWRYAVQKFSDERIGEAQLQQLLTATRMSPSSFGLQPYRLIVVASEDMRQRLLPHSMGQEKVVHCSHLIVFAAQTAPGEQIVDHYIERFAQVRGVPVSDLQRLSDRMKKTLAARTPEQNLQWAHRQTYIALGTMLTCAALMGIDGGPMEGFEPKGYDQVLGLADLNLTASVICAIGRRDPEDAGADLPKVRFEQSEMVTMV